jgi:hypothetical protein
MRKFTTGLLTAVAAMAAVATAAPANGSVIYQYVADQTDVPAAQGATVSVRLFLREILSGGSTSVIGADGGLYSMGVRVDRSTTGLPASPSILTSLTGSSDFPVSSPTVTAASANIAENIGNNPAGITRGNTGGGASPNTPADMVYLGTLSITAGSGAGKTTFSVAARSATGTNTLTNGNGYDLDLTGNSGPNAGSPAFTGAASNATPATFSVTVAGVPEPTGLGLLGLGATGLLARRRRASAALTA